MLGLQESKASCPYCGEVIHILLNHEDVDSEYIEDCEVCCRPIRFLVRESDGEELQAEVFSENE